MDERTTNAALLELEFPAEVWLVQEQVALSSLLRLEPGETLSLSTEPDGPVELVVNGTVVCTGELVVVDGKFGFRVATTAQQLLAGVEAGRPADGSEGAEAGVQEAEAGAQEPASDGEEET